LSHEPIPIGQLGPKQMVPDKWVPNNWIPDSRAVAGKLLLKNNSPPPDEIRLIFYPARYYPHWASPIKSYTVSSPLCNGPRHLFHDRLLFTPTAQKRELKSRHPFVPIALELLKDLNNLNIIAVFWADHKWNTQWQKILLTSTHLFHLLAPNRMRSRGVNGRSSCPLEHPPKRTLGLAVLDDGTVDWLKRTALNIWWHNRPKWRRRPFTFKIVIRKRKIKT